MVAVARLLEEQLFGVVMQRQIARSQFSVLRHLPNYATDYGGEVNTLASGDDAANWALRSLRVKNDLTVPDAEQVEVAFQAKLATFADGAQEEEFAAPPEAPKLLNEPRPAELANRLWSRGVDKSVLAVPEPRRIRDRDHVRSVAKQPCLICGRQPSDAHHLRFAQATALGRKVSDEFVVPVSGTSSRGSPLR